MSTTRSASGPRPSPQAAYTRWMDACIAAGWRVGPAAARVPVRDGLGRVTGAPVRARWPAPRSACAAMDGIAIKAVPAAVGVWQLATGSFAWVDTGDLMPAGMDTVVERERVQFGADGSAQITGSISRLMRANAWWPIPIGQGKFARGDHIDVQPIPGAPS
jgi:hypothetical protein